MSTYTQLDDPFRHYYSNYSYSTGPSISTRKDWRAQSHNIWLRAGSTFTIDKTLPSLHETSPTFIETYDVEFFKQASPSKKNPNTVEEGFSPGQKQAPSLALEQKALDGSDLQGSNLVQDLNVPPQGGNHNDQIEEAAPRVAPQEKTAPQSQKKEGWLLNFVLSILFNLSWVFRR